MIEDLKKYLKRKEAELETPETREATLAAFALAEAVCWDVASVYDGRNLKERAAGAQEVAKKLRQLRNSMMD